MAEQHERVIRCSDSVGRPRQVRVYLVADQLGLALPAGESATFDYRGVIELLTAVGDLGDVLQRGLSDG